MLDIIIFSVSLSLDALGIGMVFALRNILIPFKTKGIIFIVTFLITLLAIFSGSALALILNPVFTKTLGVLALFILGGRIIYKNHVEKASYYYYENKNKPRQNNIAEGRYMTNLFHAPFSVFEAPSICDMDNSRSIDGKEAIFLGLALSVDASAAGVAGGASGLSSLCMPFIVAFCQIVFLSLGKFLARHIFTKSIPESLWGRISGFLLILIGILRLIS